MINNSSFLNKNGDFHISNSKDNILKHNSFSNSNNQTLLIDLVLIVTIISLISGIVIRREFNSYQLEDNDYKNQNSFSAHLKLKIVSKVKMIKDK